MGLLTPEDEELQGELTKTTITIGIFDHFYQDSHQKKLNDEETSPNPHLETISRSPGNRVQSCP